VDGHESSLRSSRGQTPPHSGPAYGPRRTTVEHNRILCDLTEISGSGSGPCIRPWRQLFRSLAGLARRTSAPPIRLTTWQMERDRGPIETHVGNYRRRERSLRRARLEAFPVECGRLLCEVPGCGFDFETVYCELGAGFAEVHHLTPLSEICKPVCTTPADLAVVYANCHRMIHRNNTCRSLELILPNSST
jgi:hypothetical protein